MPFNKLPNTFFKLPDLGNIDKEPEEPYPFPTLGMIHSSKFKDICKIVLAKEKTIPDEILEMFDGHRLEGVIGNLELDQLADIIRHTLIINKSKIEWELIDEIYHYLDKIYTPRWELPDLAFDKGIREVFITRINWNPTQQIKECMKLFFHQYEEFEGSQPIFDEKFDPMSKKIWSFKELFLILSEASFIVNNYSNMIDEQAYRSLIQQLYILFEENYKNKIYTIEQRIVLIFLSVIGCIEADFIEISRLKIQLDNSMNLINQIETNDLISYRLLYGFVYSIFWYHLFITTSDLIMQRDLVAEIIEDIYKPENMDLETWSKYIVSSKPHPLVATILLQGYDKLTMMLFDYSSSLPKSSQRDELLKVKNELVDFNYNLLLNYLEDYFKISLKEFDFSTLNHKTSKEIRFANSQRIIFKIIKDTIKYKIINDEKYGNNETLLDNYSKFLSLLYPEGIAEMEKLDTMIQAKIYPYDKYLELILNEFDKSDSIILSETFENEIIRVIGIIFSSIQEFTKRNDRIILEYYEIMILYTINWIHKLYNIDRLRFESLMILSPLASIAYMQLAKGYIEKNNLEGAFLSYFNSYYLMEMVNQDLQGSSLNDLSSDKTINEKFQGLLKEWGIDELSDTGYIKKLFRTIESSIKDRTENRQDKSFSMGGMLDDDIVLGYLDLITQIETFNQLLDSKLKVRQAILNSEIYDKIPENLIYRGDFIGYTLKEELIQQFPFPLIRNISCASVGIKLYPIELKLPKGNIIFEGPTQNNQVPATDKKK